MTFTIHSIMARDVPKCINRVYDLLDLSKQTSIDLRQTEFYDTFYNKKQDNPPISHRQTTEGIGNKLWRFFKRRIMSGSKARNNYFNSRLEYFINLHQGDKIRLLEIGPFTGTLTTNIALKHSAIVDYVGVDLAGGPLHTLRNKCDLEGGTHFILIRDNILDCPLRMNQFDLIVGSGVLHHFDSDNKLKLARLMYSLLKPGGRVLYFEPLNTNPMIRLARSLSRLIRPNLVWEHPFTKHDIDAFINTFDSHNLVYFDGVKTLMLPLICIPYFYRLLSQIFINIDRQMNKIPRMHFIFLRACIELYKTGLR